jgi:hypothetical protein
MISMARLCISLGKLKEAVEWAELAKSSDPECKIADEIIEEASKNLS